MSLSPILACAVLATTASPIPAQIVDTIPTRPTTEILKSLQTGRERWARAGIAEYRLQSHVDCFCVYGPEDFDRQLPLLTIRNGSIIARAKGKPGTPPSRDATIDDLFEMVEEDARSSGRIIDRLELHPAYGFPLWYKAHDPEIPDAWLQVRVDSFAVMLREEYDPAPRYREGKMIQFGFYRLQDVQELSAFIAAVLPQALERFLQGHVAKPVDDTPPHLKPRWLTTLGKPSGG